MILSPILIVSLIVLFIFVSQAFELLKPGIVFLLAVIGMVCFGLVAPDKILMGFANQQIAMIYMLLLLSDLVKKSGLLDAFVFNVLQPKLNYGQFMTRLTLTTAAISSVFKNTPLVALLLPYVYDWAKRKGISPSKVMMPLSMAAVVGGAVTLIGTTPNLLVSGLAASAGITPLKMFDFTPIGLPMAIVCCLYAITIGKRILPDRKDALASFKENRQLYFVERVVPKGSQLIGKKLLNSSLRQLQGLYIAEIIRGDEIIVPVTPEEIIEEGDVLIFAGDTSSIIELVNQRKDLLVDAYSDLPEGDKKMDVVEVLVAPGSVLEGQKIKETQFRDTYDAAIFAVNHYGKKVSGAIGEIELGAGDILLILAGERFREKSSSSRDIVVISRKTKINQGDKKKMAWMLGGLGLCFLLEATGVVGLFLSLFFLTAFGMLINIITYRDLRRSLDVELMMMLTMSLVIGEGIKASGADHYYSHLVLQLTSFIPGAIGGLIAVYLITSIVSQFVTNAAAVAIAFPIGVASAQEMHLDPKPFLLTIAFAASSAFLTPFGYQTNLMVYGPGGYKFFDYLRFGIIPWFIFFIFSVLGLGLWFNMI
jgi:di/tricarboxylate transporter